MGLCHLITERLEAASSYSVRDVCGPASAESDESGADGKLLFRGCCFLFFLMQNSLNHQPPAEVAARHLSL